MKNISTMKQPFLNPQTLGLLSLVCMSIFPLTSFAEMGGTSGGGGDAPEMKIDLIRSDLLEWIQDGRATALELPQDLSYDAYVAQMSAVLKRHAVVIGVVSTREENETQDHERKVVVNGQPKTCRGFVSEKDLLPHILCNEEKFGATSEPEQYKLIHHEYAGLAGVELNLGASSDYGISSQITDYLLPVTVYRLAVKVKPCLELAAADRAKIGQQCRTSVGAIFERVEKQNFGEAWKLIVSTKKTMIDRGLIYSDRLPWTYSNKIESHLFETQAWEACKNKGGYLPSKEEFERGQENGFREILPNMIDAFWTSSVLYTQDPEGAVYAFNGSGFLPSSTAYYRYLEFSVRCVGR